MVYLINTNELLKQILEKLNNIEKLLIEKSEQPIKQPLDLEEASKYLNITKSYLYKMTYQNALPYYKPSGKKIFFKKSELDEWIFKHKIKSSEDIEMEADEYIRKHPTKYKLHNK